MRENHKDNISTKEGNNNNAKEEHKWNNNKKEKHNIVVKEEHKHNNYAKERHVTKNLGTYMEALNIKSTSN